MSDEQRRDDAGDDAIEQVKHALASIDFEGIGNSISKSVTDVARQLGLISGGRSPYIVRESGADRHAAIKVVQGAVLLPVSAVCLLGTVVAGLTGSLVGVGVMLVGAVVSGSAGFTRMHRGQRDKKRDSVLRRVSEVLGADEQISLNRLAQLVGMPSSELESYVQEAIQHGNIPEGRLTGSGIDRTLYLTKAAWEGDYRQYLGHRPPQSAAKAAVASGAADAAVAGLPPDALELLNECASFDDAVKDSRTQISDAEVVASLDGIRTKVNRVADYVARHPQTAGQLRRLRTYYLPTTSKLVRSYVELQAAGTGPQAASTRAELKDTFAQIDDALSKAADDLLQSQSMDVKADIDVMQTMLKQDGLSGDA